MGLIKNLKALVDAAAGKPVGAGSPSAPAEDVEALSPRSKLKDSTSGWLASRLKQRSSAVGPDDSAYNEEANVAETGQEPEAELPATTLSPKSGLPPLPEARPARNPTLLVLPSIGKKKQPAESQLLEALAYLLEPLVEQQSAGGSKKEKKEQGMLTLPLLLRVIEAAHERSLRRQGAAGAKSNKGGAAGGPTPQQETAARRVRQLVSTLQTASTSDEKDRAVLELASVVEADDARHGSVVKAVLDPNGAAATVVEQIDRGGSGGAREAAMRLVRRLAEEGAANQAALAAAIKPLVKHAGGSPAKGNRVPREAAMALAALARDHSSNQTAIGGAGAVAALVKLLKLEGGDYELERQAAAGAVVALVASHDDNLQSVVAQGGVAPLARWALPLVYAATQIPTVRSGGQALQALHDVLNRSGNEPTPPPGSGGTAEATAAATLRSLASAFPPSGVHGIGLELLRPIVALAATTAPGAPHATCAALVLAAEASTAAAELVESGALALFVRCLGEEERGDVVVRSAGGTLLMRCAAGIGSEEARGAILAATQQLLCYLHKDGAGAEQISRVLDAVDAMADGARASNAARQVAAPLVRLASDLRLDEATRLLCALATHPREAAALVAAGVVTPLVTQLREGSRSATPRTTAALVEVAAAALCSLTSPEAGGAVPAVAAGALPPLVKLLRHGAAPARTLAIRTLHNLARSEAMLPASSKGGSRLSLSCQEAVGAEPDAILACVLVVQRSTNAATRATDAEAEERSELAASALAYLSGCGKRAEVVAADGVDALVRLLETGADEGDGDRDYTQAARALCSLAHDPLSHGALAAAGGVPPLLELATIAKESLSVTKEYAVQTLHSCAQGDEPTMAAALATSKDACEWFVSQLSGAAEVRSRRSPRALHPRPSTCFHPSSHTPASLAPTHHPRRASCSRFAPIARTCRSSCARCAHSRTSARGPRCARSWWAAAASRGSSTSARSPSCATPRRSCSRRSRWRRTPRRSPRAAAWRCSSTRSRRAAAS